MLLRVRTNRRWRLSVEVVAVLVCVALGPRVVSALASTGEPPHLRAPEPPVQAGRLSTLRASLPTAPQAALLPPAADRDLSPDAARLLNADIPISAAPNPAARPYTLTSTGALADARAIDCLAAAVYYEAGKESLEGQRAVAQVVVNRLRDPVFPKTVCGVVFQGAGGPGCQFTFACDGALDRPPSAEGWTRARKIAAAALHGYVMKAVGGATHYHADYVAPDWSPAMSKVAVIGQHVFYRWPGDVRPAAPRAGALQVASLDEQPPDLGKLPLTPVPEAPAPEPEVATQPMRIAAAAPEAAVEHAADRMVDAGDVAAVAGPILTPKDLDWQGRPRDTGPPHLARPDAF